MRTTEIGWCTPETGPTTPGIRRPVRTMTLPSTSSRRMRLGEPTSSLPSGVTVAALIARPASRIARAASVTHAFALSRRRSSERSWCSSSTGSPVSSGSSTRMACSSSSCPVSSPSRTTMRSGSGMRRGAVEVELVRVLLERRDDEGDVLVEVDAELLCALAQLLAVDRGRERGRLHLLLDRLRGEPVDAGRPHVGAGHDEAAQLVDGVQRLLHRRVARHAEEVRVGGDAADQLRRVAARLELLERHARMAGLEVRVALVVEVVEEPREPPQLLVLAELARIRAHGGLDGQDVLAEGRRLGPFAEEGPGLRARKLERHGWYPSPASGPDRGPSSPVAVTPDGEARHRRRR